MENKKKYGQFHTTNSDLILQGFESIIHGKEITDPFAGEGDLIKWAYRNGNSNIRGYDIDDNRKSEMVYIRDSLSEQFEYDFVLTNPPYLGKNKYNGVKDIFGKHDDLYQVSIEKCLNSTEGIIIVPINFLSSTNSIRIRNMFFQKFRITKVRYFTKKVFEDTGYNVIAFHYMLKQNNSDINEIELEDVFSGILKTFILESKYDWRIGGSFYHEVDSTKNDLKIKRLHLDDIDVGPIEIEACINSFKKKNKMRVSESHKTILDNNIIILESIDGIKNKIKLSTVYDHGGLPLYSINTSRNIVQLIFGTYVSIDVQYEIIKEFNRILEEKREEYLSLFLTNFRENGRKKIGFDFVYKMINKIYKDF